MNPTSGRLNRQSLCVTCLSQERKLFPVNDSKSYTSLLMNLSEGDKLCWECHYFVLKVAAFRSRAEKAQALLASVLLYTNATKINSLSSLKTTPVYLEVNLQKSDPLQENIKIEIIKEECEDTSYECPIEGNDNSDNVPCDDSSNELDDENEVLNEEIELQSDDWACTTIEDDTTNTSMDLLNDEAEEVFAAALEVTENSLPAKSRHLYDKTYEKFMEWRTEQKHSTFSENVVLAYFKNLIEKKYKPSSLWVEYSKLKSTLVIYHQIDISKYAKLLALLKRKSQGFKAKKARTFSPDELQKFINEAPDRDYLLHKVAVIFGIMGACRRQELYNLKMSNVIDAHNTLVIQVMNTRNKIDRTFTVTGKFYDICKKYLNSRPKHCKSPHLFLRYFNGKYIAQNIGINTFGAIGKSVASYLELPNPELYTGHCLRRTSATIFVGAGGDMTSRRSCWKATAVTESYTDDSYSTRKEISNPLVTSIEEVPQNNMPSTSNSNSVEHCSQTFTPEKRADLFNRTTYFVTNN